MGKSLYRSYRSTSFDEIIGQDHITTTLKNSLANNAISHAYLLSGPRGVGKTSIARILAYEVNGFPYETDKVHLDIIEIDAASNRRIDEIREIRERVHIAPTSGKYKVYIIDEVHMLTKEAFNALLKTLEEPPAHVIFILATTELQKVPDTIVSRCIRLTFKPIGDDLLIKHLKHIAKQESIKISSEALALIAEHARGSFRDAISLLEQVKFSADKIEAAQVRTMLGLTSDEILNEIISTIENGSLPEISESLQKAYASGSNESTLSSQLADKLRLILIGNIKSTLPPALLLNIQKELLGVPGSPHPRIALELALFGTVVPSDSQENYNGSRTWTEPVQKAELVTLPEQKIPAPPKNTAKPPKGTQAQKETASKTKKLHENTVRANPLDDTLWNNCLSELKKSNNTLYGVARMAEASLIENKLDLGFKFAFHLKRINESKNRSIITETLQKVGGSGIEITTRLILKEPLAAEKNSESALQNVSNIFGGHEVLES